MVSSSPFITGSKLRFVRILFISFSGTSIPRTPLLLETKAASLASGRTGVKLDLNGKTTTLNNVVLTNNGILDIYSSVDNGKIQGSGANVVVNAGTLTTNGTKSSHIITLANTGDRYEELIEKIDNKLKDMVITVLKVQIMY